MANPHKFIGLCAAFMLLGATSALAQYPSEIVGFNGPPIDDESAQEMFRLPTFSGTTSDYLVADASGAFRASGFQTEGDAALEVFFTWVDTTDPNAWARLTTFDGPERPNPTLDTRGKVRFKLTNVGSFGFGQIALCLGIRETGVLDVPQLGDGGTLGPIEWVGVDTTVNAITAGEDNVVDTTAAGDDVQEYTVGTDVSALPAGTAVISPGTNGVIDSTPAGDDAERFGYFLGGPSGAARIPVPAIVLPEFNPFSNDFEFDLATGEVWLNGESQGGGIAGFTGNGTLADALNDRGTLEHIALINVATDDDAFVRVVIDELQVEATEPDPTPPPVILGPVVSSDSQVQVQCIEDATEAELFRNGISVGTVVPGVDDIATFSVSLSVGHVLTATQTANGLTSDLSAPVIVYAPGTALADGFDTYGSQDDLELIWTQTEPANARRVSLTSGSACSCDGYVVSDYGAGGTVSKLSYFLGSVNGTDAAPLKLTYRFKHSFNSGNARARIELSPSLSAAFGALGFAFTNGVGGAFADQYTSMTRSPDPIIEGYASDYFGYDYALTGIDREPNVWHEMQIVVKSDVVNFFIDGTLANPRDPVTGDPVWPAGVPRVNQSDFRYVNIGVGYSNNGPAMMYDNVSVTVGGAAIPFGPCVPVESPTANGPLFPGDTLVEVSDIDLTATEVVIYADGAEVGNVAGSFPEGTATVTVAALNDAEIVTATQVVGGTESCFSAPVTVAVPAPTVQAPLVPGQTQVQVSDLEEGLASAVTVYRVLGEGDVELVGTLPDPATDPATVTTLALLNETTVVATQTIGGVEGPFSAGIDVAVPAPTLVGPLDVDDTLVTVTDLHPLATMVTVYVNEADYPAATGGAATVDVVVPALQPNDAVQATQTIDGIEGPFSAGLLVANFLVVNEFNYDDPGTDDYAFVEIYNSGEDALDISGHRIEIGDNGVKYTVTIPDNETISAFGYWVVGKTAVAALPGAVVDLVDDSLNIGDTGFIATNANLYVALRSPSGVLLDAAAVEMNKEYTLNPADIQAQLGTGIWGNHVNAQDPLTSQSRFLDALDTENNGRDFGIQPATPGWSNNQPDLTPYLEDGTGLAALSPVPDWVFSYKPLVAADPTVVDEGDTPINPSAIPASPDGGLALIGWDESGGGNACYLGQLAKENFKLETYIYIAPVLTPEGYEETKLGLRGSADGVHNFDYFAGTTGVCWFLQRTTSEQVLYLLDENDGNDGTPETPICATVLGSIEIGTSPAFTGWQRLLLEVRGDQVLGIFGGTYGSLSDGTLILATHESPGPGGVYLSYREALPGSGQPDNRPPTLDAFSLTAPPADANGDLDEDDDVDFADYALFQACAGSSGLTPPCSLGDFNGDDAITEGDQLWMALSLTGPQE